MRHRTVDARNAAHGRELQHWNGPRDWGDGTVDEGPLHCWPEESEEMELHAPSQKRRRLTSSASEVHKLKLELWDELFRSGKQSIDLTDGSHFDWKSYMSGLC